MSSSLAGRITTQPQSTTNIHPTVIGKVWVVVDHEKAVAKVMHRLRENKKDKVDKNTLPNNNENNSNKVVVSSSADLRASGNNNILLPTNNNMMHKSSGAPKSG